MLGQIDDKTRFRHYLNALEIPDPLHDDIYDATVANVGSKMTEKCHCLYSRIVVDIHNTVKNS